MKQQKQSGFTIIELILFLAISALLLTMVMGGISTNVNSSRFLAATKDMQSYLQNQYNDVTAGVSQRAAGAECAYDGANSAPGASDNCIVIGKLVKIEQDQILTYTVVAQTEPQASCNGQTRAAGSNSDAARIFDYCPYAIGEGAAGGIVEIHQNLWGVDAYKRVYLQDGASGVVTTFDSIAVLRSPNTGNIYTFTINGGPGAPGSNYNFTPDDMLQINVNRPSLVCIESPDVFTRNTYVLFTGGQGAGVVKAASNVSNLPASLTCD